MVCFWINVRLLLAQARIESSNVIVAPPACVEIKCPYSLNPSDPDVSLPYIKRDNSINENHQYFTQCMVQMGVTQLSSTFFVVWPPRGHIVKKTGSNLWLNMKETVEEYYKNFYLKIFFNVL